MCTYIAVSYGGNEMDIFLIIGLVLGAICIMMALILKGASVAMLLNGEVAVIIFGGMIAAVLSSYTMADIKRLPKVMKVLMSNEEPDLNGTIEKMVELSNIARREGLLALEAPVNELDDPFMKQGLELVVDGAEAEQIRDLMESEVDAMETRHHRMSGLFKTAGATSPTLGVMGAAIGLIGALGNLSDINKLGPMIASAFVATIFGIFMGYLVMMPFATRLEAKNEEEVLLKTLIIEGVMDIQAGHSAKVIEQKLYAQIPPEKRKVSEE
ncbi:transporter, MotA/TolQ/ExbB proton channel family protein [Ligilactobacillus ruminis ATCC 25644]|uniref:Transporter, MotA/TolQ/ExbB proton channel family protein n=2 Tax=Ligilactobacillus ruminis TaxID=1623 RepID=E7FT40_9LACO|nr:transporter, MotA/TolQ/ExbB proton channel family protein [Ligilactobacillus ruminis ATCC 25644]